MLRNHILASIVILSLTACSGERTPNRSHGGPTEDVTSRQPEVAFEIKGGPDPAIAAQFDRNRHAIAREIESASPERLKEIALEIAPQVLHEDILRNPRAVDNPIYVNSFGLLNLALDRLAQRAPEEFRTFPLVSHYEDTIFARCQNGLRACRNLPFPVSDSLTSSLLLRISERDETELNRLNSLSVASESAREANRESTQRVRNRLLRYVLATSDLMNSQPNTEFLLRYVRLSPFFTEHYNEMAQRDRVANRDQLRRHLDMLATVLNQLRSQDNPESRRAYCNYVIESKPFRINLNQPNQATRNTVNGMVSEFIRCADERRGPDGTSTALEQMISEYVREERAQARSASADDLTAGGTFRIPDSSYAYVASFLQKTPEVIENMGLEIVSRDDLAFFVIDRLYYEAIDQKLAIEYWNRIRNQDDLALLRFIKNYIRGQVAYLNKSTQIILSAALEQEYQRRDGLTGDFYNRVVDRVNQATQFEWETMKTRIRFLRNFMTPIFDQRLSRPSTLQGRAREAAQEYALLKDQLDGLDEHLNYTSTSPLMLAISYYMSKAPGQVRIFLPWFSSTNPWLTIDSSQALANFFETKREWLRFFPFGTRSPFWDEYQLKHVFDFSLRTGLFDAVSFNVLPEDRRALAFGGDPKLNGEYLFFKQYINDVLVKRHLVSGQSPQERINLMLRNQELIDRVGSLCRDPLGARVRLNWNDLYYYSLINEPAIKNSVEQIYAFRQSLSVVRSDVKKVEALFDILKRHFMGPGAEKRLSPEKFARREEIIAAIQRELEPFLQMERNLNRSILEADRLFVTQEQNCYRTLHRAERYRQRSLYSANFDFYANVHAGMTLNRLLAEEVNKDSSPLHNSQDAGVLASGAERLIAAWSASPEAQSIVGGEGRISAANTAEKMRQVATAIFSPAVWNGVAGSESLISSGAAARIQAAINAMFSVQNSTPGDFGIYVDGIDSGTQSGAVLTGYNKIEANVFLQNRRDTALRVRRQLQTLRVSKAEADQYIFGATSAGANESIYLAPQLWVPMPSFATLATDALFTNNALMDVPYSADPNRFVGEAMSQFAGENRSGQQFVAWASSPDTVGQLGMRARLEFLKSVIEDGPLDISAGETQRCARNAWDEPSAGAPGCELYSVEMDNYLRSFVDYAKQFNLDSGDRQILTWINRNQRDSARVESLFKVRSLPNTAEWTYFDNLYRTSFAGSRAQRRDGTEVAVDRVDGSAQMEEFRDSFKLRIRPDRHLFALNNYVTQADRNRVRRRTLRQLERIDRFELTATQWENRREPLENIIFERAREVRTDSNYFENDWRMLSVTTRSSGDRSGTPIFLRDDAESARAWFRNVVQDFVITDSDCDALPRQGDPDFAELPADTQRALREASDCRERFSIWQRQRDQAKAEERIQLR